MTDIYSKQKRSEIMSHIKGKNTKPEIAVRKLIFSLGYRYRLYGKSLPGKPDLVFAKYKKVIFVNGCYWHGHNCKRSSLPKNNTEFWRDKIRKNVERDKKNREELSQIGWESLVIWQCETKIKDTEKLKEKIIFFLEGKYSSFERENLYKAADNCKDYF